MKNKILQVTRDSIPYVKSLRLLAGSVTACILMQQLDYWFAKHPDGFFKFLEPCPNSTHYKEGDSWTEEIGFSAAEFRTAFDSIGVRYTSKRQYDEAAEKGTLFQSGGQGAVSEKFYCSYHDKIKGVTYYFRNHELVDSELNNLNLRKPTTSIYVSEESQSTEIKNLNPEYKEAETTTETTTTSISVESGDSTAAPAVKKVSTAEKVRDIFAYWQEVHEHPRAVLDEKRRRVIELRLKDGATVDFIKQGIRGLKRSKFHMGANDRHKVFDDIWHVCRDARHLEDFAGLDQTSAAAPRDNSPPPKACRFCNDSGEVERFNPNTKQDERIECSCRRKTFRETMPTPKPGMTR